MYKIVSIVRSIRSILSLTAGFTWDHLVSSPSHRVWRSGLNQPRMVEPEVRVRTPPHIVCTKITGDGDITRRHVLVQTLVFIYLSHRAVVHTCYSLHRAIIFTVASLGVIFTFSSITSWDENHTFTRSRSPTPITTFSDSGVSLTSACGDSRWSGPPSSPARPAAWTRHWPSSAFYLLETNLREIWRYKISWVALNPS